jgi:hypothetical protein
MEIGTHLRGPGSGVSRSERYIKRMRRIARMVRATSELWEAISPDLRSWLLRAVSVVGLWLLGLLPPIIQLID